MPKKKWITWHEYRSAITGLYVSAKYAAKHPFVTFKQTLRRKRRAKR